MSRAPRLLILSASPYRGGAEEYALTIARAAIAADYDVAAAFPPTEGMRSLAEDFGALGTAYHPLDVVEPDTAWAEQGDRRGLLTTLWRALRVLWRVRPEVALIDLGWPNRAFGLILACRLMRVPTAVVFQLVRKRHPLSPRVRRLYAWARRGQRWIAVSENNRRLMCGMFNCNAADVTLVYNGASPPAAPTDPGRERAETRATLGVPEGVPLVLGVGRLHRQKGIFPLAEALPAVFAAHPAARFVWAGDGTDRAAFEAALDEGGVHGRIQLLGHRTDVPALLRAADLFVLPSLFEGFPFSVLEAAAAGCPIVTSDASSIPEIVEDGVHGVVTREGDAEALAAGLCRALADPEAMRAMAAAARARVADFTEEKMIAATLATLDGLRGGAVHKESKC